MNKATRILDALSKQSESADRPDAKRLREILPQVEESISRGVPRKKIHLILIEEGFSFTFESFIATLARLRKERKKGRKPTPTTQQGSQAPPTQAPNPLAKLTGVTNKEEFSAVPMEKFRVAESSIRKGNENE